MIGSPPAIENSIASYSQDNGLKRKSECVIFLCVRDRQKDVRCVSACVVEGERKRKAC